MIPPATHPPSHFEVSIAPVQRPRTKDLVGPAGDQFLKLAPWLGGLWLAAAAGVYAGPHVRPVAHLAIYSWLLGSGALVVAVVKGYRQWMSDQTLPSVYGPPKENFRHLLVTFPLADVVQGLEKAARSGTPAPSVLKTISGLPSYERFSQDVLRVEEMMDSPWTLDPRFTSLLREMEERQAELKTLVDAAACVDSNVAATSPLGVHGLLALSGKYPHGHWLAGVLSRTAEAAQTAMQEFIKKQELELAHQIEMARIKADGKSKEAYALAKATLEAEVLRKSLEKQREFEILQQSRTTFLESLSDITQRLEAEDETLVRLQRAVQMFPERTADGMVADVDKWLSNVVMLMRDLESIKQEAMASEHLSDLESLKPLVKTLIDSDSVFWRDMVQLQGIEVADRQVELFLEADRDTLVTAFLRHVNFVAEQDAVVAELWRTIDNEGNIYLYFYGPRGEYRPKWQAVFCKVSVYPSSRRSWLLRAYVYLNIGVHDDKSLYNWREAIGYRPSNIAKRYLRYHPVVSRQGRKQQGLQRFEEHNQRNIDEHEESHLDSKEKNSYREHTGRQSSGDTTTSTTPSANENRWTTERRSGNESSNLHSNKDQESSRDDVKDVDRVTAELHGGFRYTSQHESVYEIKETVEFGYFYLEWDRTRLVEGWRLSSMNAQSKEAFDRILGLVTGCREDLERAATEALNTRQPSANRSLGNPKQIQGATWSQLKELAILEREFSGWPFVLPKKFPHDGRPVVDDAYGDQNSEALEKKLNIQKLPPPPNLKLMNPTEFE